MTGIVPRAQHEFEPIPPDYRRGLPGEINMQVPRNVCGA